MIHRPFPILAALAALCSCATPGPDPADVSADRARWTAVRDATADGVIDTTPDPVTHQSEAQLVGQLLVEWDSRLTADEAAAGRQRDAKTILGDLLRVYGVAAVQVLVGPELQARAPEVFRLLDRNGNQLLEQDELLAIDPADPVAAVVVVSALHRLLTAR